MSKTKSKRRRKEEDFKKKKLKVGKRLPQPDNVTRTSFKATRINIGKQNLKYNANDHEDTNFKGQNLKELLNSCSHYNPQAREDALLGLKDLLERHHHILRHNLSEILHKVLGLVTDVERSVRKVFLAFISMLFEQISEAVISPFFPIIMAYLGSALTHLNDHIRLDSMKFLDCCLMYFPQLFRANSKNIVRNFVNVIATEKSEPSMLKSGDLRGTSGFKAKVTSQKTQLEILTRLNFMLQVVLLGKNGQEFARFENGVPANTRDVRICASFSEELESSMKIPSGCGDSDVQNGASDMQFHHATLGVNPCLVSNFSLQTSGHVLELPASSADIISKEDKLMEFVSSMSPVLFEYWIECSPAEFTSNLIPLTKLPVSLKIMKIILEIFVTLVGHLKKIASDKVMFLEFLKNNLFSRFDRHFVSVFPLNFKVQCEGKIKSRKDDPSESISDVSLNLLMAQLLLNFIPDLKLNPETLPKWTRNILSYIQTDLVSQISSGQQLFHTLTDFQSFTDLVKVLLLNLPDSVDSLKVQLLTDIYHLYDDLPVMSNLKNILLDFLGEMLDASQNNQTILSSVLDDWLMCLLRLLKTKYVDQTVLRKVFVVCKSGVLQGLPNVTNGLTEMLHCIFEAKKFSKLKQETQLCAIEILYYTRCPPQRKLFEVFSTLCTSEAISYRTFKYLMQVIHIWVDSDISCLSAYLSFILSVVLGQSEGELNQLQIQKEFPRSFSHGVSHINTVVYDCDSKNENLQTSKESWDHLKKVIEIICQFLALPCYSKNFLEMMCSPLCKLFSTYPVLHVKTVYRLLHLMKALMSLASQTTCDENVVTEKELLGSVARWCAVVWHFCLMVYSKFKSDDFVFILTNDLKRVTGELCKSSKILLHLMLDLCVQYLTSHSECVLTCQVLIDMLKELQGCFTGLHLPSWKVLYANLASLQEGGKLDSQIFSDFKYQYECCQISKM